MIQKRPGYILRCQSKADVQAAVEFARSNDLLVAIRGGGHNGPGLGSCDDGVVIDMSAMNDVEVDPDGMTVRAGPGAPKARSMQRRALTALPFPPASLPAPASVG